MDHLNYIKKIFRSLFLPQWASKDQLKGDIIVVTAISKNYERLVEWHKNNDPDIEFVAFVDAPQPTLKWSLLSISRKFLTPRLNAKVHKILIHEFFPGAKYTIWIDGNIQVKTRSLRQLIEVMGDNDMMVFRHSSRNCLYSEAHECIVRSLDNKEKIFEQVCRYTQEDYPQANGLAECPVIIRKHNKSTLGFNGMWWDEILNGSSRDQISFPYVQYKTGIKVGFIPGTINENDFFKKMKVHKDKRIYRDDKNK